MAENTTPEITLNDGTSIPQLGFGTYQVPPEQTAETVTTAFDVGYRHIDTAQMYQNEEGVGQAIAQTSIPRDELYITTKLNNDAHRPEDVKRTFDESIGKLGLDRVDLFLIHWPLPTKYDGDYVSTWKAMTELVEGGRLTSAGVSNFDPDHLARLQSETGILPVVNQIEVHPYFQNQAARQASLDLGIAIEAWSPLGQGAELEDPTIAAIADEIGRSPAQVILRWHIQRGDIIFPKSSTRERMQQNFDIFDFELDDAAMGRIDGLDKGEEGRVGPKPSEFDYIP